MDRSMLDKIAEFYVFGKTKYRHSESKGGKEIYVMPMFEKLKLTFQEIGQERIAVTRCDRNGRVQLWDIYDTKRSNPQSLRVVRLAGDGKGRIEFTESEQTVILQFSKEEKAETCQNFADSIRFVRDRDKRELLERTKKKLEQLSDRNCRDLICYLRNRKEIEDGYSVRKKIIKYQADIKAKDESKQKVKAQNNQI